MTMYDIILKKRDGGKLTREETTFFVNGYTDGSIPDYQAAALLMAMFFRELDPDEIFMLTDAMKRSGDVADLSSIDGIKVDKHSTGGVGDKTTLIAAPLAAACGVPVAKMSGRGLGFTGGTVDKMESVPGLNTSPKTEDFIRQVNGIGIAVIGQTGRIAPADKKLYALRDVTGTVDSLGLIASSVMSKKLASGSDAFVLDVKCGNGAFMETKEQAERLGRLMADIGAADGKRTVAFVTNMDQPLGKGVGNAIEVIEVIETLKGRGPADIEELSKRLAAYMVYAGQKAETPEAAYEKVGAALASGAGLRKLADMIKAQGGDARVTEDYARFPKAALSERVTADAAGFVTGITARAVGLASQRAGAGRERKEDDIDLSAGVILEKKVGDRTEAGETLATVFGNDAAKLKEAASVVRSAYAIGARAPEAAPLIHTVIG